MAADSNPPFLDLIEEVAEDGELTHREIYRLAKWMNENKDGRKTWPAVEFLPLLKNVFADGKIEKSEAYEVGRLIQKVRREWAREHTLEGTVPAQATLINSLANFDETKPRLPLFAISIPVASYSDSDVVYEVDFSGPICSCPNFKTHRQHLPAGHLSRCCKHIMQSYSQLRPKNGWPGWLESFLEAGFQPNHQQEWMVLQVDDQSVLLSSATQEWANVYFNAQNKVARFGYSILEDRWSYGKEPAEAEALSAAIRRLSAC